MSQKPTAVRIRRYLLRRAPRGEGWLVWDSARQTALESFARLGSYAEATELIRALNQAELGHIRAETLTQASLAPEPSPWLACERCAWTWAPMLESFVYGAQLEAPGDDGLCPGCELDLERERQD
jgi:hypothetical protein